jgi:hypothetical protein
MGQISIAELEAALDRHGADLERWPAELRQAALELIGNSEDARRLIEAARLMEEGLRRPISAPRGLADRIFDAAMRKSPPKPRR